MKETNCDVIRDLLPLYEDNVVSEETAQMVREHLKDCPECREELRIMRTPIFLPRRGRGGGETLPGAPGGDSKKTER